MRKNENRTRHAEKVEKKVKKNRRRKKGKEAYIERDFIAL